MGGYRVCSEDHQEGECARGEGVRRRRHAGATPGECCRVVVGHYDDGGPDGVGLFGVRVYVSK